MVLGGQHISRAIRLIYEDYINRRGWQEDDIPEPIRFVHAEVLRPDCPSQIARLAAGQHQHQQHNGKDIKKYDIMGMLVLVAEKKLAEVHRAYLDDAKLFETLDSLGMVSEAKLVPSKKPTKKSVHEQLVCYPTLVTYTNTYNPFHRGINSFRDTGT